MKRDTRAACKTMDAVVLTASGSPEYFRLVARPLPAPCPDEVRIRIRAAGFNPMDFQMRKSAHRDDLPLILGGEVAGEIDEVGSSVTSLAAGDPVLSYLVQRNGGYAEYVCVPAVFVAPKPPNLSFAEAAAVPVAGLTAYEAILRADVRPGDSVLVAGASGGVGSLAVQLARMRGPDRIVVTAGSDSSARYLRDRLEIDPRSILRYSGLSRDELSEAALDRNGGRPYRVAFDFVGGAMTSLCADVVDVEGEVVGIVNGPRDATHRKPENDEDPLFDKSATFHFLQTSAWAAEGSPSLARRYAQRLGDLVQFLEACDLIPPAVHELRGLSVHSVRTAHALLETGHVQGKLVMTVA
ncbi:MAG: quinone oxidoreductase family protein [Bacteroidota bacterium]